ncbi:MAG: Gfo/Idh/MocA family protein [Sphingomonas sp.]|uniref:Gfo/Idh/MocA family protein n=1 Tax=Sphingomonas sp. TaxID=28214 RepID=UPI003F7FAB2F
MEPIRIALVGLGKIARDQHVPALAANPDYTLAAIASRNAALGGVPSFPTIEAMLAARVPLDAVSLCTPPHGRFDQARAAIEAGLHVMLEKPPAATLSEATALADLARSRGVVLFATWHSREAAGVAPARAWLAERRIDAVRIAWREDIRRWHPGQDWILEAGGFGVFDPGINALSIATKILPQPLRVEAAAIVVPAGRQGPLAASLTMRAGHVPVSAEFDFLQTGPQTWDIEVDTDAGTLKLSMGGAILHVPGEAPREAPDAEYPSLYRRFADLLDRNESDVDLSPLQLVADAFLIADRTTGDAFEW